MALAAAFGRASDTAALRVGENNAGKGRSVYSNIDIPAGAVIWKEAAFAVLQQALRIPATL